MSNYRTPWTIKASSLPSDRIPPSHNQKAPRLTGSKQKEVNIPKSKAVLWLEQLRDGLVDLDDGVATRDPKGGCYCQAREHELSTYTPICLRCGLILCSLNLPYHVCPHCRNMLLAAPARQALVASLEQSIDETLAKEEREREEAMEEARRAAGAFPTLSAAASASMSPLDAHPVNQPHKVLSLNAKTKKVTVSSYMEVQRTSSASSIKTTPAEPQEPEPKRIPQPPSEVLFSSKAQNIERPWVNLRPGNKPVVYISQPGARTKSGTGETSRARKKGERGSESVSHENATSATSAPK